MAPVAMRSSTAVRCNAHRAAVAKPFAGRTPSRRNVCSHVAALDAEPTTSSETTEAEDLYAQFRELLEQTPTRHVPGDIVSGTVIECDRKGAMVDVGGKGAAFIPVDELSIAKVSDVRSRLAAC